MLLALTVQRVFESPLHLLRDGNPIEDITAVERISIVIFKGEQLDRSDLFNQE
jgi:hypothetical protein